jgi:hypothetical protein
MNRRTSGLHTLEPNNTGPESQSQNNTDVSGHNSSQSSMEVDTSGTGDDGDSPQASGQTLGTTEFPTAEQASLRSNDAESSHATADIEMLD